MKRRSVVMDYEPDNDPENWRTIKGAKVHLNGEGQIDGGAGGKFSGRAWTSEKHPHKGSSGATTQKAAPNTPEGKAQKWFETKENNRYMLNYNPDEVEKELRRMNELAEEEMRHRISASASINNEINRLNSKRRPTKEDEAKIQKLLKERAKVEHEERAFRAEFDKFKQKYDISTEYGRGITYKQNPTTGKMEKTYVKPLPGQAREKIIKIGNINGRQ
jgi:hypothetical protein